MLGLLLNTLHNHFLSHASTLTGKSYYYLHFVDKEREAHRSNLLDMT